MPIIKADISDIPRIMECAREYTDIIPDMDLNEDHYGGFWQNMLASGVGVIFLAVDDSGSVRGGIGGIKYPEALTGKLTAVEMFWYTKKDRRGDGIKLYKTFHRWAVESRCKRLAMIYLPCSMPEELHQFYTREGFTLREMHFEKEILP